MSTSITTSKTRIITLTGRAPVKIVEDDWPVIASAKDDSYSGDPSRWQQAIRQSQCDEYKLSVRQHADGRVIVYGVLSAAIKEWHQPAGGESWRGGELLCPQGMVRSSRDVLIAGPDDIAEAIYRVGKRGNLPDSVIHTCIADLPAEVLA